MKVAIVDRQRRPLVNPPSLAAFVRRVARIAPRTPADSATIVLAGDGFVRRLNATYRGKDATTDVLSFPADGTRRPDGTRPLGEIVVSVPQAARQARAGSHGLLREVQLLVLHGYLHLLGYDHEVDDGAMTRLEARLTRRLFPRDPRR